MGKGPWRGKNQRKVFAPKEKFGGWTKVLEINLVFVGRRTFCRG